MLPDTVTLDVLYDILFDDVDTANAKLAPHGLKVSPDFQYPGTVHIVSIASGESVGNITRAKVEPEAVAETPDYVKAQRDDSEMDFDQITRRFIRQYEDEEVRKFDPETDDILARIRARKLPPQPTPALTQEDQESEDRRIMRLLRSRRDAMTPPTVVSTSDERTVNNVMRHAYRVLNEDEKAQMQKVKDMGLEFWNLIDSLGSDRELSNAKTRIEEAVMWATKSITK